MRHAIRSSSLAVCLGLAACSAPAASYEPSTPPSPTAPPSVTIATPTPSSLETCLDESTDATRRMDACEAYLAVSENDAVMEPNVLSRRAEAIRALHVLGHAIPVSTEARRLLAGRLDDCVMIGASSRVVSLVCVVATCGDARGAHPFEMLAPTGQLKGQPCQTDAVD